MGHPGASRVIINDPHESINAEWVSLKKRVPFLLFSLTHVLFPWSPACYLLKVRIIKADGSPVSKVSDFHKQ